MNATRRHAILPFLWYELTTSIALGRGRASRRPMRRALAALRVRFGWRTHAINQMAIEVARLKRLARSLPSADAARQRAFCDALLKACEHAHIRFLPNALQSYVDVSVRLTAFRAFAGELSSQPAFHGEPLNITALVLEHAPDSRVALLAHGCRPPALRSLRDAYSASYSAILVNSACHAS